MTKFNIGDKVWYAARERAEVRVTCPDCLGTGVLTVRFADGKEVSIACVTCAAGYEPPTGYVSYYEYQTKVREIEICGMNVQLNKTEYQFDGYYNADENELFATKEEAEGKAKELADKASADEVKRFNAKERPTRTWAFNASYYKKTLKKAQEDVICYTAKLAAAKIKAKEESTPADKGDK